MVFPKKQLLIIDDEPSIRLILEHYFSTEYDVVVTSNGQEALNWLQKGHQADAIVADYEMPQMDGLEFLKRLRAHASHAATPLLMLSVADESSKKIQCLRQGADDYIVKPFNPEELEIRIKNVLNRVRA
ncbi:DNA-binding response OmpR family regulator [Hymenobacter luteus]|uniref:DNA-binding response OmpR family regulator n=2 Tax=Hymenobacter TaxID=89966 RepID=A0A7W9T0W4_9BACT|nr:MULTISPECIES: response regulator transcription factor [Hymenobacter]MBB4601024.1 DNA-binding response OmpR family regulator [Hymenobacter latericoloratus]MBB6058769.1 DNA-binding response OmpR family regulator [Hymenobacter luteus]